MQLAINKTAAVVGLSPTTVRTVVETYQGLSSSSLDYKCPFCDKEYKTASGFKSHLTKIHK